MAARRDVAHATPAPPPSEDEYNTEAQYAKHRCAHANYEKYLLEWAEEFLQRHPSAEHFACIPVKEYVERRGRALCSELSEKACVNQIWWPTFQHHARIVVLNRHSHEHCKSCTKTERGKLGCRFCASWPHDVECTRCVELCVRTDFDLSVCTPCTPCERRERPAARGNISFRCSCCYAPASKDKGLSVEKCRDAITAEDVKRDLYYDLKDPAEEDPRDGTDDTDERILSVEIRRRLLPTKDDKSVCNRCGRLDTLCTCGEPARGAARVSAYVEAIERAGAAASAHNVRSVPKNLLAELVMKATEERKPGFVMRRSGAAGCHHFIDLSEPGKVLAGPELHAARATLQELVAEGQPLGRLLASGDFDELEVELRRLWAPPSNPIADERKECRRADELCDLLRNWTWSPVEELMACRNGRVADHSIVWAGCVKSNAVRRASVSTLAHPVMLTFPLRLILMPGAVLPRRRCGQQGGGHVPDQVRRSFPAARMDATYP